LFALIGTIVGEFVAGAGGLGSARRRSDASLGSFAQDRPGKW
jgi:hypothetical protein